MKKSIFNAGLVLLAAAVLVSACNNKTETPKALVTVTVNDFTITQEDFPAAQHAPQRAAVAPADYNGVGAMTLAFYNSEGTEVYKTTQVKSDNTTYTTFGTFTASLPIGNYTMVAVGYAYYDGDVFVLTGPTEAGFTSERPRETFSATQDVTVTNTTPLNLNVTLSRISSMLTITSTDVRPVSATKVRTTFSKGAVVPSKTIVASNSLVNKDFSNIEPYTLLAGMPASVKATGQKRIFDLDIQRELDEKYHYVRTHL